MADRPSDTPEVHAAHPVDPSSGSHRITRREFLTGAGGIVLGAGLLGLLGHAGPAELAPQTAQASTATYKDIPLPTLEEPTYSLVSFSAVGDNLMNLPVVNAADANVGVMYDGLYDFTPMYSGVKDIVESHDLNFIDIETILGGDYFGITGYPVFNSPSCIAEQVADFGWNLATTATNHSLDVGIQGIFNSCETWAQFPQVTMTGTFNSWEDRETIRIRECNGIKFAFLAYTDSTNGIPVPSGYDYVIALTNEEQMIDDVTRAHELADVVIVAMSWGSEYAFEPNSLQRYYAQLLANHGVDLIVGFGPHVIQPIEWYEGYDDDGIPTGSKTLVVFSLGNFLSNQPYTYTEVEGCFTCDFLRLANKPIEITNLMWTPLINHISGSYHEVFKLKDYTYDLAWSHNVLYTLSDPIGYAYDLTEEIIGPSGVAIND